MSLEAILLFVVANVVFIIYPNIVFRKKEHEDEQK